MNFPDSDQETAEDLFRKVTQMFDRVKNSFESVVLKVEKFHWVNKNLD